MGELFKKAGDRFAGPVAEHHDGFAMWDSKATPWNAKDKGPNRDVNGELEAAIKGRGLKFITTFHYAHNMPLVRLRYLTLKCSRIVAVLPTY